MGRVSRYKKVKSIDPFSKNPTWNHDVGDASSLRRAKKRSKTSMKLRDQRQKRQGKRGNRSSRQQADEGFDLPPRGGDEFDWSDLVGSVKVQKFNKDADLLSGGGGGVNEATAKNDGNESWSRKIQKLDLTGVPGTKHLTNRTTQHNRDTSLSSKTSKLSSSSAAAAAAAAAAASNRRLKITADTTTSHIIEACSNNKKNLSDDDKAANSSSSKKERKKAFLSQKKKKRKRSRGDNADNVDDINNSITSNTLFQQPQPQQQTNTKQTSSSSNKFINGYTSMNNAFGEQVERPPVFSSLPRGAKKIKVKHDDYDRNSTTAEERIVKEKKSLEALRQKAMAQYAILRESRRKSS